MQFLLKIRRDYYAGALMMLIGLIVVNEGSGDVAIIRVRTNSLLTMIPVGDKPQDLAVKLF